MAVDGGTPGAMTVWELGRVGLGQGVFRSIRMSRATISGNYCDGFRRNETVAIIFSILAKFGDLSEKLKVTWNFIKEGDEPEGNWQPPQPKWGTAKRSSIPAKTPGSQIEPIMVHRATSSLVEPNRTEERTLA
jgi:hypothetical protein